jgi:hypothetical protein
VSDARVGPLVAPGPHFELRFAGYGKCSTRTGMRGVLASRRSSESRSAPKMLGERQVDGFVSQLADAPSTSDERYGR